VLCFELVLAEGTRSSGPGETRFRGRIGVDAYQVLPLDTSMRRQGRDVRPELAKHVASLGWAHIGLTGDYVWSGADQPADGSYRPLQRH
jgi:hypothetical protein